MKRSIAISVAFVAAFGISLAFAAVASGDSPDSAAARPSTPVALSENTVSHAPCHLVVELCMESSLDRGPLTSLPQGGELTGSFRYWDEDGSTMLYVYDDVGNLLTRVRNPQSVIVLGHAGPQS